MVVSGKNEHRDYFTFNSMLELLSEYFQVLTVFPTVPSFKKLNRNSLLLSIFIRTVRFFSTRVKLLKFNSYVNAVKLIDPSNTYQSGFVCLNKSMNSKLK